MIRAFSNRHSAEHFHILDQMFRQRHEVYVRERGWNLPLCNATHERDQFDNDDAIYLLALDDTETVLGGSRIVPTTKPHLLKDVFPELASNGVPVGDDIYELTRFFVSPECRSPRLTYWLTGVLACGLFEYCLENDIRQLSSVIDLYLLNHMLSLGWSARPLGLPRNYAQGEALAVLVDVTEDGLQICRQVRAVQGRVLETPQNPLPPMSIEAVRRASRVAVTAAH